MIQALTTRDIILIIRRHAHDQILYNTLFFPALFWMIHCDNSPINFCNDQENSKTVYLFIQDWIRILKTGPQNIDVKISQR